MTNHNRVVSQYRNSSSKDSHRLQQNIAKSSIVSLFKLFISFCFPFVSYILSETLEPKQPKWEMGRSVLLSATERISLQWLITARHEKLVVRHKVEWIGAGARIIDLEESAGSSEAKFLEALSTTINRWGCKAAFYDVCDSALHPHSASTTMPILSAILAERKNSSSTYKFAHCSVLNTNLLC